MIDYHQIQLIREQLKILSGTAFFERIPIPEWQTRSATYVDYGQYRNYSHWKKMRLGDSWDCRFDEGWWFEADVAVPESMAGKRLVLELCLGGEGLVSVNGKALSGVTFFSNLLNGRLAHRTRVDLCDAGVPGTRYHISFQTNMNYKDFYKGSRYNRYADDNTTRYTLKYAWLCAVDDTAENLILDVENLLLAADSYNSAAAPILNGEYQLRGNYSQDFRTLLRENRNDALYQGMIGAVKAAFGKLSFFDGPEKLRSQIPAAAQALQKALSELPAYDQGEVSVSGFAHMDIVWLWEDRHTIRKVENTFRNALALIDRYPEYLFSFSQPYTYSLMERYAPDLFREIIRRVRDGHIDPVGNLWIELDPTLASGESIVRQLLYGRVYALRHFGQDSRVFFLPDSFGFPASLPQIIRRSGIRYFFTSKLSTNEQYHFPFTYFLWQGIDGTRVPSYAMRVSYNGRVTPDRLNETVLLNENKPFTRSGYLTFGYGDGGGGAEYKMIESVRRFRNLPGIPRLRYQRLEDYLDSVFGPEGSDAERANVASLPVWDDELYLDRHRGTLTTLERIKYLNRRSEFALRRLEILSSVNALLFSRPYPAKELEDLWKEMLRLQFHDRLPGSTITQVNRAAVASFETLLERIRVLQDQAAAVFGAHLPSGTLFNPLSFRRTVQTAVGTVSLPPLGWSVTVSPFSGGLSASEDSLENRFFRLRFLPSGALVSLIDKRSGREMLKAPSNVFHLYEEITKPQLSAWDIHPEYLDREIPFPEASGIRVRNDGDGEASVSFTYRFGASTLIQEAVLYSDLDRIDFRTRADWHESMKLLKVSFSPSVHTREASYEIQFGAIRRPTHRNTSFDAMRFEASGHRWADLSAPDHGLSVLTDCKYGFSALGDELSVSLLRAPLEPDCTADRGAHEFTYSLYPHDGSWDIRTVQAGLALNEGPLPLTAGKARRKMPEEGSFFTLSDDRMILDSFKRAEDGDGYIIRLYEATGGSGEETVSCFLPFASVTECNLMEQDETPVSREGDRFRFSFTAFQIRSFRLRF